MEQWGNSAVREQELARLRQSKEDENRSGSFLAAVATLQTGHSCSIMPRWVINTKTAKPGHFSAKPAGIDIQHFIAWKRGGILASHLLHSIPELFWLVEVQF